MWYVVECLKKVSNTGFLSVKRSGLKYSASVMVSMGLHGQCKVLTAGSLRSLARTAVKAAAERAMKEFVRHARMARMLFRAFAPCEEKIAGFGDMDRIVPVAAPVNRRSSETGCFRKEKERVWAEGPMP